MEISGCGYFLLPPNGLLSMACQDELIIRHVFRVCKTEGLMIFTLSRLLLMDSYNYCLMRMNRRIEYVYI